MYRPTAYRVDDHARLHEFIRTHPFATIAVTLAGTVHLAYAPVVLDEVPATLRFHLAAINPVAAMADDARVSFSFMGPQAYVSPDWYVTEGLVPTWNYMAVEASGPARRIDRTAMLSLLADLSAAEEARLLPKPPWTMDKVPAQRLDALMHAIVGFVVPLETLQGKFKLSQDKAAPDRAGVIAGLESQGKSSDLAAAMRALAALQNDRSEG